MSARWESVRAVAVAILAASALVAGVPAGHAAERPGVVLASQVTVTQESAGGGREVLMVVPGPSTLKCRQEYRQTEPSEGTLGLRFVCAPTQGLLNWDFRLSASQQAQIPLGLVVHEAGLTYNRNGSDQLRRYPHLSKS